MQKTTKPLKTLRLRKEVLKVLTTDQLTQAQGGTRGPLHQDQDTCCAYGGTALNSASN